MKMVIRSVIVVLIAIVAITGLYWFGKAALYKHEAKQEVMSYLRSKYKDLEFHIKYMHHGFFGGSFIGRDFTVSIETKINSKNVNFFIWTDGQGKVREYTDTLVQEKIKMDAEEDVKAEVKQFIPSVKGVAVEVDYDAKAANASPFIEYSRDMEWLSLKSIDVSWNEESDLAAIDFVHKSIQLGERLSSNKFKYRSIGTNYFVNGKIKMSLELQQSQLNLPDEQLLKKIVIPTGQ